MLVFADIRDAAESYFYVVFHTNFLCLIHIKVARLNFPQNIRIEILVKNEVHFLILKLLNNNILPEIFGHIAKAIICVDAF